MSLESYVNKKKHQMKMSTKKSKKTDFNFKKTVTTEDRDRYLQFVDWDYDQNK